MATNTRAKYANKIFKSTSVATAIDERAMQGHRTYRIVQELPFDLSNSEAAKALEEWLDQEQFGYIWRPTYLERDGLRPSIATEFPELVITW